MSLVEGTESEKTSETKEQVKNLKKQRKITSTKRELNYIDQLLDEAVCED